MHTMNESRKPLLRSGHGRQFIAFAFIASGLLLLAHNLGWISRYTLDLFLAWHSLFLLGGIYNLLRRRFVIGSLLLIIGGCGLANHLHMFDADAQTLQGPLLLMLIGAILLTRQTDRRKSRNERYQENLQQRLDERHQEQAYENTKQYCSTDGFLYSDNSLGAARHVVLDELFKGGRIRTSLGGTVVDLRRTKIAEGETYIDLECRCGSIELYIPSDWHLRLDGTAAMVQVAETNKHSSTCRRAPIPGNRARPPIRYTTGRISGPHQREGRNTHPPHQPRRTALHPGLRRLCHAGYSPRRVRHGADHEILRSTPATRKLCAHSPFHHRQRVADFAPRTVWQRNLPDTAEERHPTARQPQRLPPATPTAGHLTSVRQHQKPPERAQR